MRPIVIACHERPVSIVRFNKDGDIFFTGSLDGQVSVFWTDPVERLGTYASEGAVKSLSVTQDSKLIIVGSAINGIFAFEVETGAKLMVLPAFQLKQVEFAAGDAYFFLIHNKSKLSMVEIIQTSVIRSKQTREPDNFYAPGEKNILVSSEVAYTHGTWGYLNTTIVLGTSRGVIDIYDVPSKLKLSTIKPHFESITDIRFNADFSLMISASRDAFCNIYDPLTMKVIRTYNAQRPLNSAVISPLAANDSKFHAIIGGGQETRDVTITKSDQGGFEITVFNMMYGNEVGALKGHFGPVHSLDIHPKGGIIISGSEDGNARFHKLDNDYFTNKN